jgi:cyclopropane fatty-acyl-phospholipid synthase-like methyltransferase
MKYQRDMREKQVAADNQNRALFRGIARTITNYYSNTFSVCDYGCGSGTLLEELHRNGHVTCHGIEGEKHPDLEPKDVKIMQADLSQPILEMPQEYDLAISFEVAEHIPEHRADVFVENIASHTTLSALVTAAPPGQPGEGHINCQPREYWIEKFANAGMEYNAEATEYFQGEWRKILSRKKYLIRNLGVYDDLLG